MNKLAFNLLFLSLGSFAQLQPGYYSSLGIAYEDFGTTDEYPNLQWSNLGTHEITIDSLPDIQGAACIQKRSSYSYSLERNPTIRTGSLTVNQAYGSYNQVLFNFGKAANGGRNILDLSNSNANFKMKIENVSDSTLRLWFTIYDSTGHIINSISTSEGSNTWSDFYIYNLPARQMRSIETYFGRRGFEALFDNSNCGEGRIVGKNTDFNPKVVSGIGIAVLNQNQNEKDSYKPYPLKNIKLEISYLLIGHVITGLENNSSNISPIDNVYVYPNPATEKISFSERLDNIILKDIAGNITLQSESASELDLSMLPKGIYILSASNLTQPSKIIIK